MKLDEFKEIWQEYDKRLDKQVKFNTQMFRKMNLDQTRSALDRFTKTPILGMVLGLAVQLAAGTFIYHHWSLPQFVIPSALIWLFGLFQVWFSGFQLSVILPTNVGGEINYDLPVTEIQKKLEKLRVHRVRYLTVTRFSYGLLWLPVLIVGLKGFFNYDFYVYFNHKWILSVILCGLAFTMFGIWLSLSSAEVQAKWPVLKKVTENIRVNDVTGKGLDSAMISLEAIEDFEKED
jgi:serine/threonine-protein kinase